MYKQKEAEVGFEISLSQILPRTLSAPQTGTERSLLTE